MISGKLKIIVVVNLICLTAVIVTAQSKLHDVQAASPSQQAMTAHYEDLTWQSIVPELKADSPQIAILRVDPQTKATQLLIRTPTKMHVPMHWHTANETHTIIKGSVTFDHGGKIELMTPGSFNYMPSKMPHQAWASAGAIIFITVDGAWDVNWATNPPGASDLNQNPPVAN